MLADALGLEKTEVLAPTQTVALKKVVAFVPRSHINSVREELGRAGAGILVTTVIAALLAQEQAHFCL